MRIYISGPLQGSSDLTAARRFYDQLAATVDAMGHESYVPHHHTDPRDAAFLTATDVFDKDRRAIEGCDAVIAHIGLPSTGVGAEIALAITAHQSVLGLKRPGEPSSRFAEGLITGAGGVISVFADGHELEAAVSSWLQLAESARANLGVPEVHHRHLATHP